MSVTLRKRKLGGGRTSLYLDVYHQGKRDYEFLNLYLTKDRESNRETIRLAESIAAKRQLEIQNAVHGFIPLFKRKANFIEYFENLTNGRTSDKQNWQCVLTALKDLAGDRWHRLSETGDQGDGGFGAIPCLRWERHCDLSQLSLCLHW